ncbi:MAG: nucleotidyl transferase AbiEii/AbiGii toxin family protein [Clostridia bacterium]|nr:nucleotidyl transferase AbiEii/AbiGii toxin family protein [Clostridia bacterium]
MLSRDNYTAEHIAEIRSRTGADPSILERTVYAFGLLEAIRRVEMPFVFKGGTSLLVLLKEPKRLSTDIDIIVDPSIDVDSYIRQAGKIFPFLSVEENQRKGANNIEKRHFRFRFSSPVSGKDISILLDVVFEHNPYEKIIWKPIRSDLLLSDGEDLAVQVPDINCILGDKLTAFAPHTTGIPFGVGKELEIIKQMFDCWTLLREMDDYRTVASVYNRIARLEMSYRGLMLQPRDALIDTINSCLCIMGRNGIRPDEYKYFLTGINAIQGHIFSGRINGENAGMIACEVMHLAACLLTEQPGFERISSPEAYRSEVLTVKGAKKLGYIRNNDPMAYAHLIEAFRMLQNYELFTEEI